MERLFDQLYEQYHQAIFQFIYYMVKNRETAEELVQDVYIKVLQSYDSFAGNSSEKTWLFSIARHTTIDWIRKQNRQKRRWFGKVSVIEEEAIPDQELLPEEIVTQRDEMRQIYKGLQQCSLAQQQVVILRFIEQLSIAETADVLGWSESKVKTTQHRAIKALQELIAKPILHKAKEG